MTDSKKTTYLLAGHGSRNREGNDEIEQFAEQWRAMHPDWRIEVCFIEHAEILLNEGLDRAAQGADRVVLIPFILNAAGHVKMELPAAVDGARERHPAVEFFVTRHLGMGLHAERGGVAMGANHVESRLGQRFATQARFNP